MNQKKRIPILDNQIIEISIVNIQLKTTIFLIHKLYWNIGGLFGRFDKVIS